MHQVLFHLPLFTERFPPDGIPVFWLHGTPGAPTNTTRRSPRTTM